MSFSLFPSRLSFLAALLVPFASANLYSAGFTQTGPKFGGSTATLGSQQGSSVAISADGNTAVVGALGDNSSAGAIWIFTRNGINWTQQGGKLVGSNAVAPSAQGVSVAISNDGNTVLVGGYRDNVNVGATWVFVRSGSTWTEQARLIGTGATGKAQQGSSVALSGDGNTAVIGGPNDASTAGAIWIFTRAGTTWSQVGNKLVGTGASGLAGQGRSVAISQDGLTVLAGGDQDASGTGALWVWNNNAGTWTQAVKLVPNPFVASSGFGSSCALSASGNVAAVGGPQNGGAVWIYTRTGGVWAAGGTKLVGVPLNPPSAQGSSVALSLDGNTLLAGGYSDNSNVGAMWAWTQSGGTWTQFGGRAVGTGNAGASLQGVSVAVSGDGVTAALVGGSGDNTTTGAVWPFSAATPEIAVEQPAGTDIPDGGSANVGAAIIGSPSSIVFTIRNTGNSNLTGLTTTIDGANGNQFSVTVAPTAPVTPGSSTTFTLQFAPTSSGHKTAALHIASNDADENPFDINLSGDSLSFSVDTDGDGMSDAAEYQLSALGFDWQVAQPSLVNTLYTYANGANLYTPSQLQAMHINQPFIQRDASGNIKITLSLQKSADLINYAHFNFISGQTMVNANGDLEFTFPAPGNSAFFILTAH